MSRVLPRLLYVGDVPVENRFHGSALLYRLLEDYPPEKLMILEAEPHISLPERRLPRVTYGRLPNPIKRLMSTRFHQWAGSAVLFSTPFRAVDLKARTRGFAPEAVLTVAHGYSWMVAAEFAKSAELPLHLIVHDHYLPTASVFPWLSKSVEREFGQVYRRAASRLPVSPFMEEEYRKDYGAAGQVLYPSRSRNGLSAGQAPATYKRDTKKLTTGYAGNIFSRGYASLLVKLAECLKEKGGQLMLFGPHAPSQLRNWGLDLDNVLPQGLLTSDQLVSRLHAEVDFLFVPMSFEADGSQRNMRIAFPSKLTDYTATGLPLLICGPDYCSAVRWAQQYAPVAEVVTSQEVSDICVAVNRLDDPSHREFLGRAARLIGDKLFGNEVGKEILYSSLLGSHSAGDLPFPIKGEPA